MIADAHFHLLESDAAFGLYESVSLNKYMDEPRELGVDKALVCTVRGFWRDCKGTNDSLAAVVAQHPTDLRALCSVAPRDGYKALDELNRCVNELGMVGIKLHPWLQGVSAVDPLMWPIMEEVVRMDLIVMSHDGTPPYCTTEQIAYLAKRYPTARIMLGHSGMNDAGRQAARLATRYENLLLCTCSARVDWLREMVRLVGPDRLFFGSDWPFGRSTTFRYQLEKIDQLGISDDDKEKILYRNLLDLVSELRG